MDTFHYWGRSYKIEFDIKVNKPIVGADSNGYVNIFRMTTLKSGESETGQYGDRIPIMFANSAGFFLFRTSIGGDWNDGDIWPFQINQKYHVEIVQFKDPSSTAILFTIKIDGGVKYTKVNTQPTIFPEVNLYLSDKDYPSFGPSGELTNFCVTNLHNY